MLVVTQESQCRATKRALGLLMVKAKVSGYKEQRAARSKLCHSANSDETQRAVPSTLCVQNSSNQ